MEAAGLDYSVHEAWTDATNVYLVAALASVGLLVYARRFDFKTRIVKFASSMALDSGLWSEDRGLQIIFEQANVNAKVVACGDLMKVSSNRRKIQRIFGVPPSADRGQEDAFLSDLQTVRLRQQLEMYYMCKWPDPYTYIVTVGHCPQGNMNSDNSSWELNRTLYNYSLNEALNTKL